MTNLQWAGLLGLIVIIYLDILAVMVRTALWNAGPGWRMIQRERDDTPTNGPIQATVRSPHALHAGLSLLMAILHFLGCGLVLAIFMPHTWSVKAWLAGFGEMVLAAVILFWIEWIAESLALRDPERWVKRLTPFLRVINVIVAPFLVLPLAISNNRGEGANAVTEADLKTMVDAGEHDGVLEEDEREMIYSIFQLGDTLAREIMVPRIDMLALEVNTPLAQAVEALVKAGYSRLPVYEETVDHILGVLYARDLLRHWRAEDPAADLRSQLRPAYFVPEAKKVDELLAEMQAQRIHMAIVVDEFGGVAGLVTLEDIVEEIVGEIQDEYDQAEEMPYQLVGEGEYLFLGRIALDDFNEIMGSHLDEEDSDTLGGLVYNRIGRVPSSGESVQVDGIWLTVEQVSGRRIRKVRARRLTVAETNERGGNDETDK